MTQICNALRLVQAILQAKAANGVNNSGRCVVEHMEIMSACELAMGWTIPEECLLALCLILAPLTQGERPGSQEN